MCLTQVFTAETKAIYKAFEGINTVYWSIAIEVQFYLVVYLALQFKKRYHYVIGFVTILALVNYFKPLDLNHGFFLRYWLSFAIGIVLAYVFKAKWDFEKLVPRKLVYPVSVVLIALVVGAVVQWHEIFIIIPIAFAVILWLLLPFEKVLVGIQSGDNFVLRSILKAFTLLGAMSYSIYLLHTMLYHVAIELIQRVVSVDNNLSGWLSICLTLVFCYPFYWLVEKRFMSKRQP